MSSGGYMGKVPWIDLGNSNIEEVEVDERMRRDFIGGYGIGSRIIYERQKAGVGPLAADNIFGFFAGPLTGTKSIVSSRFMVMGKSPLTGTWGDANCGGFFGPHMKFAGVDGLFFNGAADRPVYLYVENGKCEIREASHLWGKKTSETEQLLIDEHGKDIGVACIGPSGERRSLISAIIHDNGRAAARSRKGRRRMCMAGRLPPGARRAGRPRRRHPLDEGSA